MGQNVFSLPPFSLILDFGKQNTRGNVSKISVSHTCYRHIGSKSTNHRSLAWRREGQKVTLHRPEFYCLLRHVLAVPNRPYSYSRYWTGTSLKLRLMRGSLFKCKWHLSLFKDIPPHEPPLQASSRPIPRIRIWPISKRKALGTRLNN